MGRVKEAERLDEIVEEKALRLFHVLDPSHEFVVRNVLLHHGRDGALAVEGDNVYEDRVTFPVDAEPVGRVLPNQRLVRQFGRLGQFIEVVLRLIALPVLMVVTRAPLVDLRRPIIIGRWRRPHLVHPESAFFIVRHRIGLLKTLSASNTRVFTKGPGIPIWNKHSDATVHAQLKANIALTGGIAGNIARILMYSEYSLLRMLREKETTAMSYEMESFSPREYTLADQASVDERAAFITKTYLHLFGAILAFIVIEALLLNSPAAPALVGFMLTFAGAYSWLVVLGAFMLVSFIADRWAHSSTSLFTQYLGLGLYVAAEAVIFLPLLFFARQFGESVIPTAGIATAATFTGLTAVVLLTRKNFSFLGPFLGVAGFAALGFIACSILFGFNLGTMFTVIMIGFACAYILYDTSRVLHEYHVGQHVAAALALFAAVALLFWYILRLVMAFSRD